MGDIISARRRLTSYDLPPASETAPYAAVTECWFDTNDGTGATIHPSVVDMGSKWNGYRWWCADTPYANQDETLELPSIYASNDRINWHTPAGLANPIHPPELDGTPGVDPELVWDQSGQRLICYWLHPQLVARFSYNGVDWSPPVYLGLSPGLSPTILHADGWWWMSGFVSATGAFRSLDPLSGWVAWGNRVGTGHHGDVIYDPAGQQYLCIEDEVVGGVRSMFIKRSRSFSGGWSARAQLPANAYGPPYRPGMALSTKPGWVDIWYSVLDEALPNDCKVAYTRIPISAFPPLPPT